MKCHVHVISHCEFEPPLLGVRRPLGFMHIVNRIKNPLMFPQDLIHDANE
jgi:hypothetical protein